MAGTAGVWRRDARDILFNSRPASGRYNQQWTPEQGVKVWTETGVRRSDCRQPAHSLV